MLEVEYQQFKENIIKEIRQDEDEYGRLQEEIRALQDEIKAHEAQPQPQTSPPASSVANEQNVQTTGEEKKPIYNEAQALAPAQSLNQNTPPFDTGPTGSQSRPSSGAFERTLPPPSPQRSDYGHVSTLPIYPQPVHQTAQSHSRTLPPPPGLSPMPPPLDIHTAHRRTPSGTAALPNSLPYQHYAPYNYAQPPWPPQQQYPQHGAPYSNPQFYAHTPNGRTLPPVHTPVQNPFPYYPQSAPMSHYNRGQPVWQAQIPQASYTHSASASNTPAQHQIPSSLRTTPGSSTPWKRKSESMNGVRPRSPSRPVREVSPLSDVGTPAPEISEDQSEGQTTIPKSKPLKGVPKVSNVESQIRKKVRSTRQSRAESSASSTRAPSSRSQSITSRTSDARPERGSRGRRSQKIKPEPPSTPAPFPSDNEQQPSSGRRRTRGDTITSRPDIPARLNLKRKRDSVQPSSPPSALPSPVLHSFRRQQQSLNPDLVPVTKSFGKLGNQFMSEVTNHKYAGIFAKALSEREAPGYKDLVFRPQDLKNIKVAITKGSKAANAAIEDIEQEAGGTPSKTAGGGGSTIYYVKKTEDLIPPKGIVSSSQLEMELVRMFANAIMFNPLPASERGLPKIYTRPSASPSSDGENGYEGDDDGIIRDTRQMFEDVVKKIVDFRMVEHGEAVDDPA